MLVVKGTACISNSKTNYHTITTASFLDLFGLVYGDLTPLSTLFQLYRYIVAVSVIGGGNRSTRKKPPTCRKSLDVLYYCLKRPCKIVFIHKKTINKTTHQ
jgi:hypothetical protein